MVYKSIMVLPFFGFFLHIPIVIPIAR